MYQPDPRITRQLQAHDDLLYPEWAPEMERWTIKRKSREFGKPDPVVMVVQSPGGEFRPLDERVITEIILADAWRYKDAKEFMRVIQDKNHCIDQRRKAEFSDYVQQVAKEDLYPAMHGTHRVTVPASVKELTNAGSD